ncbi:MAG TPA: ribulose-phosphate 3-epimerase, partial [Acidobacteriota bacterium]|nr:ribulose-phosphate 3-epimerase [Acidobacteriota bacterium]
MDGHFVPNITIGPVVVQWIRAVTPLPFDVHLMIEDPDQYIEAFVKAGANLISVHFETCNHLNRTLQLIRSLGCKAGVVLNPASPVEWLEDALADVDYVLVMSVNPGFGGQKFLPVALQKTDKLRALRAQRGLSFAVEIDGGIGPLNLRDALSAGADWFVAGSSVFQSKDPAAMVRQMKDVMKEYANV